MTLKEQIVEKLQTLSPERQRQVLALVTELEQAEKGKTEQPKQPLRSLRGLWKDLNVNISEEDMAEARHEMWGSFPREFPPE